MAQKGGVCFRQAVIAVDFEGIDNRSFPVRNGAGTRRLVRDRRAITAFRQRLATCFRGKLRSEPNRTRPRVVFIWRSRTRILAHPAPAELGAVVEELGGTFRLVEDGWLPPAQVIREVLAADILVGAWGSSLVWLSLLPPGAVVVQFTGFTTAFGLDTAATAGNGFNLENVIREGSTLRPELRINNTQFSYYAKLLGIHHYNALGNFSGHPKSWYINVSTWHSVMSRCFERIADRRRRPPE
jgi:hypothetical protein